MIYQELHIMKEFGIAPGEWRSLRRFDRLVLFYSLIMNEYYSTREHKRMETKFEAQRNREKFFMENMPKVKSRK